MYCTKCGQQLREGSNFCSDCGHSARPEATPSPLGEKRLMRVREGKKIAGVCAGFARYIGVDVTLVRLVWLIIAFMAGAGFLAYIVAWIAMPKEPEARAYLDAAPGPTQSHTALDTRA
jgi:phage shock protein C